MNSYRRAFVTGLSVSVLSIGFTILIVTSVTILTISITTATLVETAISGFTSGKNFGTIITEHFATMVKTSRIQYFLDIVLATQITVEGV